MTKATEPELPKTLVALLDGTGKLTGQSPGWQQFLAACGTSGRERLLELIKHALTEQTAPRPLLGLPAKKGLTQVFYAVDILPLGTDGSHNILLLQQTEAGGMDWATTQTPLLGLDAHLVVTKAASGLYELLGIKPDDLIGKSVGDVFRGFEMGFLLEALQSEKIFKEGEVAVVQGTGAIKGQWSLRYLGRDPQGLTIFLIARAETPAEVIGKHHGRMQAFSQQMTQILEATNLDAMLAALCDLASKIVGGEPVAMWVNPRFIRGKLVVNQKATTEQRDYFDKYCRSEGFLNKASELLGFNAGESANEGQFEIEIVPVKSLEQVLGLLLVKPNPEKAADNSVMRHNMLELLIQLHSTVLYHALEVEKLRHDHKVQTDLLDFTSRIANLVEMEQLLAEVAKILRESFGYQNVFVGQVDLTQGIIKPFHVLSALEVTLDQDSPPMGIMGWVVHYGELLNVVDTKKDSRYLEGIKGIRSELALPVKAGRGQIVGVIDVQSPEPGAFTEVDEKLLGSIAAQVASAMQNAQLFALVNRNFEDAKNLLAIQADMTNQPSFVQMLIALCRGLTSLIPGSTVIYLTQEKNYFRLEFKSDGSEAEIDKIISMPTSLIPRLTLQTKPFVIEGKDREKLAEKLEISPNRNMLVVPIHFSDQTLDGLTFAITESEIPPNTLNLVQIIGSISNSILENRLLWEREQLVMHNVTVMSHLSHLALESVSLEKFIQLMIAFLGKELDFCEVRFYTANHEGTPRLVSRYQSAVCEGLERELLAELEKSFNMPDSEQVEWRHEDRLFKIITIAMKDETTWGHLQAVKEVSDYRLMRDIGIPNLAGILNSIRRRMASMDKQASMLLELQSSQKMRSEFLAKVSHELRTPLTTILAYTDMLTGNVLGELTGEQGHALESIEKSGRHLFQLINDLLDFSAMEQNEDISMDIRPVDIKHAADEAVNALKPFADEKKVSIQNDVAAGLPKVMADSTRLVQVLTNLVTNAIKFTEPGDTVIVRAEAKNEMLHVHIEDHGIGIKPEDQMRVFEAFVQLEDVLHREHGGAGIGLAITQNLVSLMGGELSLYSEPGKGSVFSFTLPLA